MKRCITSERYLLAFFLAAWSLYLFYPFTLSEPGVSADGVTYIHIAKNIVLDGSPGWQATWAAPFFSVLIAAVYPLVENFAVAGMVVSKIMTVLLPLAVFLLGKEIFSGRIGIIAAILTAFHPHFTFISGSVEPEATYTTLQAFSLWAMWKAFNMEKSEDRSEESGATAYVSRLTSHGYLWAVLAGVLFSLTYQTRSEGLLILIFTMAAIVISSFIQKRLTSHVLRLTVILVVFILTSLPYLVFLKGTYGKWVLSPKSSYVQIWMKWRVYHDNDLGEQSNPELWGLSKNGKLMWQEPKGVGDLISYLMSHPEKSIKVYLHNFWMQLPGNIPNNSGQWLYPQVFPWYFVVPALFWVAVSLRRREDLEKSIFLISPFFILFVLPIFTEGWWKYLLPYSPFLVILAVAGLYNACERLPLSYLPPALTIIAVAYSLWTVKASPLVKHGDGGVSRRVSVVEQQKKAGEWAKKRFQGNPNYMVQWSKLAYYLDGRWTAMPVADYYGIVWYARLNSVDYLVFETSGRGESEELARVFGNTTDLELADIYESPAHNYGVVFFRLRR